MSLRARLLLGIALVNVAAFSVLAVVVVRDLDNRETARLQAQAAQRESHVNFIIEMFVRFYDEFDFEQLDTARLLEASYWKLVRDASIMNFVYKLDETVIPGDIGLNPLGAHGIGLEKTRKQARKLMANAFATEQALPDAEMVAFPLYGGTGARRQKWGAAYVLLDLPTIPAQQTGLGLGVLALALGGATAVAMGLVFLLLHVLVLRPLRLISDGAERVSAGTYTSPVPKTGHSEEIDDFIGTFNQMMADIGQTKEALERRVEEVVEKMRLTEKRLVLTDRLAAVGTLAAGIAHEINNPLGGMLNAVRSMRRKGDLSAGAERYLSLVEGGLGRIRDTVQRILRFSPHQARNETVRIAAVVEDALRFVQYRIDRADVEVVHVLDPDLAVRGDPAALGQVFLNLIVNALDAIDGDERRIEIRAESHNGGALVTVADSGEGMDDERRSQAFNLFFTTKKAGSGTGLGLSIVHQIVTEHGGAVEIDSEPGAGTRIHVLFPSAS